MLHPNQFQVNEAWIAFKLNDVPMHTEHDGDFNCVALMDAASCFILHTAFVAAGEVEPSRKAARTMLKKAQAHKKKLAQTLYVPGSEPWKLLVVEAEAQGITTILIPEDQLSVFIDEARDSFREHFAARRVH